MGRSPSPELERWRNRDRDDGTNVKERNTVRGEQDDLSYRRKRSRSRSPTGRPEKRRDIVSDKVREKDQDVDRARDKERDRERERDRDRDRDKDRDRERDRDKDRGNDRDRDRERERDRDRDRDREKDRDRDRDRDRDWDREKDRDRDRERDRDRDRTRDRDRAKDRERDRDRDKDAERDRDKDRAGDEGKASARDARHGKAGGGDDKEAEQGADGAGVKPKAEPLSLEEILKKKKLEAEAQVKPVFLSKKEREALAMQRREEEAAAQRLRAERLMAEAREAMKKEEEDSREKERRERDKERERARQRDKEREERERQRADAAKAPTKDERGGDKGRDDREKGKDDREKGKGGERDARGNVAPGAQDDKEKEKELEGLREMYLGQKKFKKRVMKPSDKFRFNFDWENTDDTSRDFNPLYQNPHEAAPLFGRGLRAGIDRREQKKQLAKYEREIRAINNEKVGHVQTREERDAEDKREVAANQYDTFDMRIDRHWTEKKLNEMTERDWRIFREDFNIAIRSGRSIRPMRNWEEAGLPKELMQAVEAAGYKKPSPIQMAAIPLGLANMDVLGTAETGSGKTAAFVLPMLVYISHLPPMTEENEAEGPYAVIMAPTRELVLQIEEEIIKLAQFMDIRTVSIVGGQSIEEQGFKLRKGCEVIVATPGRLLDCLERRYAVLNQCHYMVLDEADRMIDMGFEPQVVAIMDRMPSTNLKPENEADVDESHRYRMTYMFSATMPPAVERLARKYLRHPAMVMIGTLGKATDTITQNVVMIKENEKMPRLLQMLEDLGDDQCIIFANTKKTADMITRTLDKQGYRVTSLHGGKAQDQREANMDGFRSKKSNILVATDVAGRGIDVPDVAQVINYDMANHIEPYTHRIGRTGRAGKKGIATTFLTLGDTDVFYDLKQMLNASQSYVPPELARHEAAKAKPGTVAARGRNDTIFL